MDLGLLRHPGGFCERLDQLAGAGNELRGVPDPVAKVVIVPARSHSATLPGGLECVAMTAPRFLAGGAVVPYISEPSISRAWAMESPLSNDPEYGAVHVHASLVHEQSAGHHEVAAALWDARGDVEWAEFERRCAALERELAQLEVTRADFAQLYGRSLEWADESARLEIDRLGATIRRREAQLATDDAILERERDKLRRQRRERREPTAAARIADLRDEAANQRDQAADERDRIADERDEIADHRERTADHRDDTADQRDHSADQRERAASDRVPDRQRERLRVELRQQREEARGHRQEATAQRKAAERQRLVQRTARRRRETAERLASTLSRAAEALDESAELADAHGRRDAGRRDVVAEEQRAAELAREAAELARRRADHWLEIAAQP